MKVIIANKKDGKGKIAFIPANIDVVIENAPDKCCTVVCGANAFKVDLTFEQMVLSLEAELEQWRM